MKNTIELAAEFIRRAAFVDAHALLKDESGFGYKKPSQVQYYALFKDRDDSKAFNEALKHVAYMLGCMTYIEYRESASKLTIVGEEMAVDTVRHVCRIALKTYTAILNERVSNTGRFHTNEELEAILSDAAERHLKRLKFEPYIVEYNLKED